MLGGILLTSAHFPFLSVSLMQGLLATPFCMLPFFLTFFFFFNFIITIENFNKVQPRELRMSLLCMQFHKLQRIF